MQTAVSPMSQNKNPLGTGGFLDPESIANRFGIEEGMTISDFGSGAGYFTIALAQRVGPEGHVYAFDIQENALDNVMAKARANSVNNIEIVRANLEIEGSSGLAKESQDMVLLANILFQSQKRSDIIREAGRILKRGGKIIIIDWKKKTGGFGPPDDIRLNEEEMEKIATDMGLSFEGALDAGQFHFGLIFKK